VFIAVKILWKNNLPVLKVGSPPVSEFRPRG
jgi:hypothetical protein